MLCAMLADHMNLENLRYYTKSCKDLTDSETEQSSFLFSNHYGLYGNSASIEKKGRQIRLGKKYYENLKEKLNYFVSFAFDDNLLVGHAYFLRKTTTQGMASWVIQLVVHSDYRHNSIGSKLLHSVWGFSNDYAWGLATSNPLTVKTLESVTVRKAMPSEINSRKEIVYELANDISFVEAENILIDKKQSNVFNKFYVDQSNMNSLFYAYNDEWTLGPINEGSEWIAFTFKDQDTLQLTKDQIDKKLSYSDAIVKEAYSRMEMQSHSWTKYSKHEIDFILSIVNLNSTAEVVDFGCGFGRHLTELKKKGFQLLKGIDFSKSNIEKAKQIFHNDDSIFICGDCREINLNRQFDLVLCLYDVIGSFPNETDNDRIIDNIAYHTKTNGFLAISVMNFELTESLVEEQIDIYQNPECLFKLRASNTMQSSGNVFDSDLILIDKNTKLVFRKETFENENHLATEYIIRDKRYTMNEIVNKLIQRDFSIIDKRFVQAGKWQEELTSTNKKAKEILIIAKKN